MTHAFRLRLRRVGIAVDEEIAQQLLAGRQASTEPVSQLLDERRQSVLEQFQRQELMREWEIANPGRNAYPKPFAQRVLELAREAATLYAEDGDVRQHLLRLETLALAELSDDDDLPEE